MNVEILEQGRLILMSKDLETLFDYLKKLNDNFDKLSDKIDDIVQKQNSQQISIKTVEINVENIDKNISAINNDMKHKMSKIEERCEEHKKDLKTASNFIMVHDAKEKTLLGVRVDFVAWVSLICAFVAMALNIKKILGG